MHIVRQHRAATPSARLRSVIPAKTKGCGIFDFNIRRHKLTNRLVSVRPFGLYFFRCILGAAQEAFPQTDVNHGFTEAALNVFGIIALDEMNRARTVVTFSISYGKGESRCCGCPLHGRRVSQTHDLSGLVL